eukprot:6196229-Pleurochrysis_carterae.AAC.3
MSFALLGKPSGRPTSSTAGAPEPSERTRPIGRVGQSERASRSARSVGLFATSPPSAKKSPRWRKRGKKSGAADVASSACHSFALFVPGSVCEVVAVRTDDGADSAMADASAVEAVAAAMVATVAAEADVELAAAALGVLGVLGVLSATAALAAAGAPIPLFSGISYVRKRNGSRPLFPSRDATANARTPPLGRSRRVSRPQISISSCRLLSRQRCPRCSNLPKLRWRKHLCCNWLIAALALEHASSPNFERNIAPQPPTL